MDKETLKSIVIEYKDSGMTYQEISDKINKDYGIKKSRQALQKMYHRAIEKAENNKEKFLITTDVVNIYCLGYAMTEVKTLVSKLREGINYNDIVAIIRDEGEYIKEVEESILNKLISILEQANDIVVLKNLLSYKGIEPTDKKINQYIGMAYKNIILDKASTYLATMCQLTDDTAAVKKVISELNMDISMSDIREKI